MALNNLFGGRSRASNQAKNVVEFRAGKMTLKGESYFLYKRYISYY